MVSFSFPTLAQARAQLQSRGMSYGHTDAMQSREYWLFTDGRRNVCLDHSATVTRVAGRYHVSDFATAK